MRIVFVCDAMESGGAEKVISTLSNNFVSMGHEVSIIMLAKRARDSFYELNSQIQLIALQRDYKKELGIIKKTSLLRKTIVNLKPNIVISFLSYVCIYTWRALKGTNIPYIVSERNDPNSRGMFKQFLLNRSFKNANGCVFQTSDALKWYEKISKKSTIIYNPVNLTFIPKETKSRKKQILFVGRLTAQKNCNLLIDAFSIFYKNHKDYQLKIYGEGPLKSDIQSFINNKSLNKCVFLEGNSKTWHRDEYNSACFVLSSNYEGMPNALTEALCLGIPSVSTNCPIGGPKELKKIFPNLLFLCNDADAIELSKKISDAIAFDNSRSLIPKELNEIYIAEQWIDYIKEVLQ